MAAESVASLWRPVRWTMSTMDRTLHWLLMYDNLKVFFAISPIRTCIFILLIILRDKSCQPNDCLMRNAQYESLTAQEQREILQCTCTIKRRMDLLMLSLETILRVSTADLFRRPSMLTYSHAELNLGNDAEEYTAGKHPGYIQQAWDGIAMTVELANESRIKIVVNGGALNPKGLAERTCALVIQARP